jgi:xanthine dehydrogenase small subunit
MSSGHLTLNGRLASLTGVSPHTTALDWLRSQGLTGAKEGCAEGECGACAVLVARPGLDSPTEWVAVNACLVPAASLEGQEVVTVEGLGTPDDLHPIQRELAERGGSQCGYCTPGFVCSMAAEYYRPGRAGRAESTRGTAPETAYAAHAVGPNGFVLDALGGNLCRCTGYRPIRDAAFALGAPAEGDPLARRLAAAPPVPSPTRTTLHGAELARPSSLADALALWADYPDAVVVAGSTDWGVEVNLRGVRAPFVIVIDRLPELRGLDVADDAIEIGAALTLTEIEQRLAGRVPLLEQLLPQFASRLIRNAATLGGNLATASPIGDAAPALLALGAEVVLVSESAERVVPIDQFFTGYRHSALRPGELIRSVRVPQPLAVVTDFQKVAKRRLDDISSVAVAVALDLDDEHVRRVRIGLGGVAATPIRALATEDALLGRPWNAETVAAAADVLAGEGTPLDDHRASAAYRRAMLGQALHRLHARTTGVPA